MQRRLPHPVTSFAIATALCLGALSAAHAAPRISNVSLRGLQAGGVTTIVIEGAELLPEPHLWFSAPVAKQTIKDGATAERLEVELAVDGRTAPGVYLLRAASASGISEPVAVAVDSLQQIAFAPQVPAMNMAMTGALTGNTVLATSLAGKKGQHLVIDVEARRLGSNLNPVVRLYDHRRVQLAWSPGLPSIAGDARCEATLPADGEYMIEIHDRVFRGANPGFFRLKVGEFSYADLVYPLAVTAGSESTFEFAGTNLPDTAKATASWSIADGRPSLTQPAPWPADVGPLSGARPGVIVSQHAEIVEAPPADALQEVPAAPVAINGRLQKPGEQDQYRLVVVPKSTLRFDVLAHRAGSPLDGVLTIRNEQGGQLAANDDRPNTSDPGLDFTVPDGTNAVVLVLGDLEGRGGADFVYRIAVTPIGVPDFSLSLAEDRYLVPRDGAALARVLIQRAGYGGPVKLQFPNLPSGVSVAGDEIPAGAVQALVTLSAPGASAAQSLTPVLGASAAENTAITRAALPPQSPVARQQPWLGDEVAVAVTGPSPLALAWEPYSEGETLSLAGSLPVKLNVTRAEGAAGAVRLSLLTTQVMPRKKVTENNQEREVDDVERAIRFEADAVIAADQSEGTVRILVPADLPRLAYDIAVQADLLGADNKQVLASAVTPARRLQAALPISVELAAAGPVEARAGLGPVGKIAGKIHRLGGYAQPVAVTLVGLPANLRAPSATIAADQTDFELPVSFPYGVPAGDLAGVTLVASSIPDPKKPEALLKADAVGVALKVVPGDKPPPEQPLAVFEDQVEFLANLKEGGGQASLIADQKYSGLACIRVTPDQRFNPALPGLGVNIREYPGPGEFRYLRFAWKKQGGQAICLQLNHDGQWGPVENNPHKFRYHAGPSGELFGGSLEVDASLPAEFTVVTRDLFADFGEFKLTGIALTPVDGEHALFDHIYLGTKPEDFDLVKPQ